MKTEIGNLQLNVVDTGAGEPALVFLRYWGGAARTWESVIKTLEQERRCVAFDQRGWGSSDAPETGYELADLAGDLLALVTRLGLTQYALVGHSMGGKVAMLAASQQPPGLKGLVLVAPASPFPQRISVEAREAQRHAYDNRQTARRAIDFLTFRKPNEV